MGKLSDAWKKAKVEFAVLSRAMPPRVRGQLLGEGWKFETNPANYVWNPNALAAPVYFPDVVTTPEGKKVEGREAEQRLETAIRTAAKKVYGL